MMRSTFCLALCLFIGIGSPCLNADQRPNVVFVITDDQGYGDLSCHGNSVLKTPNLDQLFRESVRLTDYHVAPTCSPTRAALQTGRWTNRTGVWHTIMGRSLLRHNEVTMGQIFHRAGYATGFYGKWHLGDNHPFRPEDRGYDEVLRHGGGGVGQTPDYWNNAYFGGHYYRGSEAIAVEGFCTDVWFEYAQQFIKLQQAHGRPFLAVISTNAAHGPMHSPVEFSEPYADQGVHVSNFFGMIANIDDNVGKMRQWLARNGLAERTIFVFTTDNGTAAGEKVFNARMRGKKGSEYDGGHRVPFFIHWPAGELNGGRDVSEVTAHVDVLPTLIDLCGIEVKDPVRFDGRSLKPLLDGTANSSNGSWPDRILVTDSQRVKDPVKWRKSCVMTDQWRLINGKELYAIRTDPQQQTDVAADHPDVVSKLTEFYESWWSEIEPTFKQQCDISLGHATENPARLTCHDWITDGSTPWHQGMIRRGVADKNMTGYWNVNVVRPGTFQIRLRRWPEELDAALDASIPPGDPVPGVKPMRMADGKAIQISSAKIKIGEMELEKKVAAGEKEVEFEVDLAVGPTRLYATFGDSEGNQIGAYYAYVLRKE